MIATRICVLLFVGICFTPPTYAAETDLKPGQGPVTVTSDRLDADQASGSLVFLGNAVAQQDDVTLYADRLTVYYSETNREVEKIIAEGHVRIVQEQREATGSRAVFERLEERITLTGNPRVSEQGSFVEGQTITLYLKDRRSTVTGGDAGRVNAVFQPKPKEAP